ncbi:MAG: UbiX family flavin prenyltransferase [Desulfovibrio sp.]|jgi:4-hydroxy-3-polyprenylbenzoate decarboxylase|nr:UbiX family flavin prenyltransferase [Desulfovibrio sp.]
MKKILVGISGASGMPLAQWVLRGLSAMPGVETHCIVSRGAQRVLKAECACELEELITLTDHVYDAENLAAGPASGSWWHDTDRTSMLIVPCSMRTLGSLAGGISHNLIHRAGDVALKEGLRLVLVCRETPLSLVHLRNMLTLKKAGAVIMPFSPGFYTWPSSLEEMLQHFSGRIFDQLGLQHACPRWREDTINRG